MRIFRLLMVLVGGLFLVIMGVLVISAILWMLGLDHLVPIAA